MTTAEDGLTSEQRLQIRLLEHKERMKELEVELMRIDADCQVAIACHEKEKIGIQLSGEAALRKIQTDYELLSQKIQAESEARRLQAKQESAVLICETALAALTTAGVVAAQTLPLIPQMRTIKQI